MIVAAAGRSLPRCCSNTCRTFSAAAKATPDQEVEGHSLFFPLLKQSKDVLRPAQLHVNMFLSQDPTSDQKQSVLLLHGAVENGFIFYGKGQRTSKGLAPFLARNGFNVFVADFRFV